jgi:hypothetical protein
MHALHHEARPSLRGHAHREEAKPQGDLPGKGRAGDTRGQAPGSKWCAVKAIVEHADFGRKYTKRSNQLQRGGMARRRLRCRLAT